ncbi:MAG: UDP-2,4-diacetamido-2,4,6-trideoxy-beta-L-altropyranose hydrolase [Caldimonas sp.]
MVNVMVQSAHPTEGGLPPVLVADGMLIAFRVDASVRTGIGHLKRCLALAAAVRSLGGRAVFVTRELGFDSLSQIKSEGFEALLLAPPAQPYTATSDDPPHAIWAEVPQLLDARETAQSLKGRQPKWLVVDHYAFDHRWHREITSQLGARLCVIDDLADRGLVADVVVDQNPSADHVAKYSSSAGQVDTLLVGTRFSLLSSAYNGIAPYKFNTEVRSIGIFMGGTDATDSSSLALRAARNVARFEKPIEICTTSSNPHLPGLKALAARSADTTVTVDSPDLADFFRRHDLQIGAGGGASWERCALGAPTLAIKCAANQAVVLDWLETQGVVHAVDAPTEQTVGEALTQLIAHPESRRALCEKSRGLVDGQGAARVALALLASTLTLRPATQIDAAMAYSWRDDPSTRRYFRDPRAISLEEHLSWWTRTLTDPQRSLFVARVGTRAVGTLRFDFSPEDAEVSIYLDPQLTGLGIGIAVLRAGQRLAQGRQMKVARLVADIHPHNQASISSFAEAGFTRAGTSSWSWDVPR